MHVCAGTIRNKKRLQHYNLESALGSLFVSVKLFAVGNYKNLSHTPHCLIDKSVNYRCCLVIKILTMRSPSCAIKRVRRHWKFTSQRFEPTVHPKIFQFFHSSFFTQNASHIALSRLR